MKITIDEFVGLSGKLHESVQDAFKAGIKKQKEVELPNSLFEALLEYGVKSDTIIDYHRNGGKTDGCNWIQLKPTRDGSKGVKHVEISFEENKMDINFIGIRKDEK